MDIWILHYNLITRSYIPYSLFIWTTGYIFCTSVFILHNRFLELAGPTESMTCVFSWQISWFFSGRRQELVDVFYFVCYCINYNFYVYFICTFKIYWCFYLNFGKEIGLRRSHKMDLGYPWSFLLHSSVILFLLPLLHVIVIETGNHKTRKLTLIMTFIE